MSSQPKKKDFFNGGKGVDPSEFDSDTEETTLLPASPVSPVSPVSPRSPEPPTSISFGSISPRPLEFPSSLSASNSPPPVYPLPAPYGLYPPTYSTHSPYLPHPMCPTSVAGGYPIPGMPYGSIDIGAAAAAHGAASLSATSFAEAHLARSYASHPTYSPECWINPPMDNESKSKDSEMNSLHHDNSSSSSSSTSTRQQKCSLCFNHGLIKEKKGHKWQCTYKNCECQRCIITKGRQKTMRDQQKLTRHLQKIQL